MVVAGLAVPVTVMGPVRCHGTGRADSARARQATAAMPPMASGSSVGFTEPAW